ncbi:hypothetical protein GGI17_005645 [Coemansia sp. S146]|nr:hypothetical protein GGI17_005645 [Coemansia sp. S146]
MSMTIYTESSCVRSGTPTACAGIGVFLGPGHQRNFSGRLPGKCHTSNRTEFGAIKRALLILSSPSMLPQTEDEPVFITTRSKYAIGCDLIVDIITLLLLCPYKVHFMHTPAAAADEFSVRAKSMATSAARSSHA